MAQGKVLTTQGATFTFMHMSSLRLLSALTLALAAAPALANAQQSAPRPQPESVRQDSSFGRRSLLRAVADTVASRTTISTCPMRVVRPDTTRLERMPRARVDTAKLAPMPIVHGCVADAK